METVAIMSSMPTPIDDADDLCRMGASALVAGYKDGSLSPVEVAEATLARAEVVQGRFNAFTMIARDAALTQARESEARWRAGAPLSPVDGVPTTIKDIVRVNGWSVRYGSTTTDATPYAEDAPSVRLMREAGLVFLGLTTTPEFGWKAVTDCRFSGTTRNPFDPSKTSGGSSGGAAVAAATGAGVFHLGTDGGGSIRIPSTFCGIAGLKPTFGRVPAYPASAFGTVAHIGPMARRSGDLALMLAAMSGRDLGDWFQGAGALDPLSPAPAQPWKGARVGYWSAPPCGSVDPAVKAIVDATVEGLASLGARVEPFALPDIGTDLLPLFHRLWFGGAAARLRAVQAGDRERIDPGFLAIAAEGAALSAADFIDATNQRAAFGIAMDRLLEEFDFVVAPGTAIPAFEVDATRPAGSGLDYWTEWAGFSFPINLSQQPAAVVPCGRTAAGLPVGLQIIAARGADARVLAAAADFETAFPDYLL